MSEEDFLVYALYLGILAQDESLHEPIINWNQAPLSSVEKKNDKNICKRKHKRKQRYE